VLAAAGLTLVGCGSQTPRPTPEAAYDGFLVVAPEPGGNLERSFNPFSRERLWGSCGLVYEPLLIFNTATQEYVPWLATEHAWSPDNRRLTFTLRDGVSWADGKPFTAEDVAFSFDLLRRHPALDVNGLWEFLGKVEAVDPSHVTLEFKRIFTPGLAYVGQLCIVPAHRWASVKDPVSFPDAEPVGTGAFNRVGKVEPRAFELEKNPAYWQPGKPVIRGVRLERHPTNDVTLEALVSGRVDWAGVFIKDVQNVVARDPHLAYWFPPHGDAALLYLNTTEKPFDDARVRKALSRAIDRDRMVKQAIDGHAVPADVTGLTEAYRKWKDAALVQSGAWTRRDVAAAEAALDGLGLKRGADGVRATAQGKPMKYTLEAPAEWTDWAAAARIAAENLRGIGVDVEAKLLPVAEWRDHMRRGRFQMLIGSGDRGPTPYQFYCGLMGRQTLVPVGQPATSNYGRFVDEEATRLLQQLEKTSAGREMKEIASRLAAIFDERAPVIPLFSNPSWGEYSRRRFKGFPDQLNPYAPLAPHQEYFPVMVLLQVTPA
jgi:peptide/nickel transport system substrate-binding protein